MPVVAQFEFKLRAIVRKRRKWYLAICLPLDVASQGPTKEKALANLRDAVRGFLADCYERGTLENVLQEAGFVSAQEPSRRARQHKGDYWLTVPIALLAREHHAATLQES
jgi:predicted RNase H-like HicB family nuclease